MKIWQGAWRLEARKLLEAFEAGSSVEEIREFLATRNGAPLPGTVSRLLEDVADRSARVQDCGLVRLLECADVALAALIADNPASSSRIPLWMALRDSPHARCTRLTPPWPNALASLAAVRRRVRSSSRGQTARNFALSLARVCTFHQHNAGWTLSRSQYDSFIYLHLYYLFTTSLPSLAMAYIDMAICDGYNVTHES